MPGSAAPTVDAIVVNRDRAELVLAALRSVAEALVEAGAEGQTIVVDNGSTDHSRGLVTSEMPHVRWIQLEGNNGFPAAVNAGLEHATADWVLLLNNDATIDRHAIKRILERPIADDVGTVAMQMRFTAQPDVVNSAGIGVDVLGIAYDRFLGTTSEGPAAEPAEVFGACGGAALYRRAMLDEIGRFDADYFLYLDDADVAWRSRMAGWRAVYVPEALVWHAHSATTRHGSSFKYFHVGRSRVRLLAKNADRRQLVRYGLQMLAYDVGYVVFVAIMDRSLAPLRGRLVGFREWRRLRRETAAERRPVELDRRQGFSAAMRRRRAWIAGGRRAHPEVPEGITPLVLGMGWFPDQENGVNRYSRSLLEALGGPPAVVVGPARDAPPNVCVVERHDRHALRRALSFTRAALRRAARADVVDIHFAMYAVLPVLLGMRGKPFVVHFQGPWGAESLCPHEVRRPKAIVRLALERVVYRRAAGAIVLSEAFKDLLVRRYGVCSERVRVVRPGVDLDRFSPGDSAEARRRLGLPAGRPIAVTARRLVERTGVDVLLESWARVIATANGVTRPLLVVVGDGEQRDALEAQARQLGLDGAVRFMGKVSDSDLVAAYRAADVAVVPSISLEGFGLVVLEALACGTPVVGTAVQGLREALEGLDPALLVPPGDADALADRLRGVLNRGEPASAGEHYRAYAEGFTWQRTAREVLDVYRSAVRL